MADLNTNATNTNSPAQQSADEARSPRGELKVVLQNGSRRFVVHFESGEEAKALEGLASLANDPRAGLAWFDAAKLTREVGLAMSRRLKEQSHRI